MWNECTQESCIVEKGRWTGCGRGLILSASFCSLHLLYSFWASEHILRFPIFQAISNFPNDIFSFFRDRQWNQKMSSMGKIMVGSYSKPCLHSSHFLWGNEFQWFISFEPCLCKWISWDGLNWLKTNVSRVKN